jgi:ribonucleotide reductase alpha subunit
MRVKNRNGELVPVRLDEITDRITKLSYGLDSAVIDPVKITLELADKIFDGISTSVIDSFAAEICHSKVVDHPHFNILAGRLVVSDHHKNIEIIADMKFSQTCYLLYNNTDQLGNISPLVSHNLYKAVTKYKNVFNDMVVDDRDFSFDYFGFKTLYKMYLKKVGKVVVETPQHMLLRNAIGLHGKLNESGELTDDDFSKIKETYDLTSQKMFTHATPMLFNSGTERNQLSSCFLLPIDDDINSIFKVLSDSAKISKWAGGIGIHASAIRSDGAYIRGTGGCSDGIVPMLKVFNDTAKYINQGGKRSGSYAMYLEPWHADIQEFLKCKLPHGDENRRAKDLFYALWIPDIFMERVRDGKEWSLMDPSECPGLNDLYGEEFNKEYERYESEGRVVKTLEARELMDQIISLQIETGNPYMCYKDAVNKKSNQKNVGTIKSSNLCVVPETRILTKEGWYEISTLENKNVEVWNGEQWSNTIVKKTGENQKIIKVTLNNGSIIQCTPYHEFWKKNSLYAESYVKIEAQQLSKGDKLLTANLPKPKKYFDYDEWLINDIAKSSKHENNMYIIPSYNKNHLVNMMLYLQYNGIYSHINEMDGIYNLYVPDESNKDYNEKYEVYVMNIEDEKRISDTYCFTEELRHMGMFEGILTSQCSEIMEYSDTNKYACCVLGSMVLPSYVINDKFDFDTLGKNVRVLTKNLNKIIDINYYPVPETKTSNMSERPIGIGIQGLADVFFKLKIPYDSELAIKLDSEIAETIYYNALLESMELSKINGPYETYKGSPISKGQFQFDLWEEFPTSKLKPYAVKHSKKYDWDKLKKEIKKHGVRNSLVSAYMPTASTSQIMGSFSESFEPITSNCYVRKTKAGDFIQLNHFLANDLIKAGLWKSNMKDILLETRGSIQNLDWIPDNIKNIYKTVWEMKQKSLIDHSLARASYIDQSQSLNLYFETGDFKKIYNSHMYGWESGLKTGLYYLRTQPAINAASFTKKNSTEETEEIEETDCLMCSS